MVGKIPKELKEIHDYLFKIIPEKRIIKVLDFIEVKTGNSEPKITYDSLIDLHEKIKNSLHCYNANKTIFKHNFRNSLFINSIIIKQLLNNEQYILKDIENFDLHLFNIKDPTKNDETLEKIVYPILNICASIIFVLFGLILIASETSLSFSTNNFNISIFSLINSLPMYDWTRIILIILSEILFCIYVYYGIFNFKFSGYYALYSRNQTEPANLVWSAVHISRLSAPLIYNFLFLWNIDHTSFEHVIGSIKNIPIFGISFPKYFPIVLILLVFMNLLKLYDRFMISIGFAHLTFSNAGDNTIFDKGISLLKAEIAKKIMKINFSRSRQINTEHYFPPLSMHE